MCNYKGNELVHLTRSSVKAREQMIQEAVNEVNCNHDIKREKASQTWMEIHHEDGVDGETKQLMNVNSEEEDCKEKDQENNDDSDEEGGNADIGTGSTDDLGDTEGASEADEVHGDDNGI